MKNKKLVYQAKSFYNAYIALEQLNPDCDEMLLLIPRIVNGAFSIELTLKAILTELGITYAKEHNLKVLFEKLPLSIQDQIWNCISEKNPFFTDKSECEDELLLISNAFVQWRYSFEGSKLPAINVSFISVFANAVIHTMFKLGYNVCLVEVENENSVEEIFVENREYFKEHNKRKLK